MIFWSKKSANWRQMTFKKFHIGIEKQGRLKVCQLRPDSYYRTHRFDAYQTYFNRTISAGLVTNCGKNYVLIPDDEPAAGFPLSHKMMELSLELA
jgi:hypothetical protein